MRLGTQMLTGMRRRPFDPYWHWCELMLNADGADASTSITDSSKNAKTVTLFGDTQLDTSQFAVGTASILFDGTGDYIRIPNSGAFDFGSGDFYIGLRIKNDAGNVPSAAFIGAWGASQLSWVLYKNGSSDYAALYASANGTSWNMVDGSSAGLMTTLGQFHTMGSFAWLEVFRVGSTIYGRRNGTSTGGVSWSVSTTALYSGGTYLYIGADYAAGARLTGRLDEIRILKGISQRTGSESSWPIPTAPRFTKEGG